MTQGTRLPSLATRSSPGWRNDHEIAGREMLKNQRECQLIWMGWYFWDRGIVHVRRFKLIGRRNVFTVERQFTNRPGIPCVAGRTCIDGHWFRTVARVADVEWVV